VLAVVSAPAQAATLALHKTKSGSTLTLDGLPVYATPGLITHQRLIAFQNSKDLVAVWDETSHGVTAGYFAICLDGRTFSQVAPTENKVRLRYQVFDPLSGEPVVPEALRAGPGNETFLVQFVSTPLDAMRKEITALGGTVEGFLTDNTHVVRMTPAARERIKSLPYVRWVGACHPAYRLSSEVRAQALTPCGPTGQPLIRYSIACFQRGLVSQRVVADAARALGGIVEVMTPGQFRLEVSIPPSKLATLARLNEVSYIDLWGGPGGADMQFVRRLVGATDSTYTPIGGYSGQGVRGEVHDSEVRTTHDAFQNVPILLHGGSAGSGQIYGFHGTAIYGIHFSNWPGQPVYNGMVTDAEQGIFILYALSTQFGGETSRLDFNLEATDPSGPIRSCYQSSSVGSNLTMQYNTISQETDDYLFLADYLSCQSQSNAGNRNSRPQAWAKNIIALGGVNWYGTQTRSDDEWTAASYGPAMDGRQKPDLTNCYDQVPTTWGFADDSISNFGGTSTATAITAGMSGILMQMWHAGAWPGFGGGDSVFADRPRSTTVKAMLINTAYRYPLNQGGLTRARQGWGMPALDSLYNIRSRTVIVNESDTLTNAQVNEYTITVAPDEPELKVTMVFRDPKGNVMAFQDRINDLTLRVTAPNNTVYWGNNGLWNSNFSSPGGQPNTIDTVENVFIQDPIPGTWTVSVIGSQIVEDAHLQTPNVVDADYALVVTGGLVGPPPQPCYANCDQSTSFPTLTANDFQCFLNLFAANDPYADCDGVGGLTANDFQCFLNAFAVGCP